MEKWTETEDLGSIRDNDGYNEIHTDIPVLKLTNENRRKENHEKKTEKETIQKDHRK